MKNYVFNKERVTEEITLIVKDPANGFNTENWTDKVFSQQIGRITRLIIRSNIKSWAAFIGKETFNMDRSGEFTKRVCTLLKQKILNSSVSGPVKVKVRKVNVIRAR